VSFPRFALQVAVFDPAAVVTFLPLDLMSYLRAYAVAFVSMLGGAAFVHNIYKPDLVTLHPIIMT
jgi:hypothetical protein